MFLFLITTVCECPLPRQDSVHISAFKIFDKYHSEFSVTFSKVCITLSVSVPPDILDYPSSSDMVVPEGSNVSLRCAASGSPTPNITWRRDNNELISLGNGTEGKFYYPWFLQLCCKFLLNRANIRFNAPCMQIHNKKPPRKCRERSITSFLSIAFSFLNHKVSQDFQSIIPLEFLPRSK